MYAPSQLGMDINTNRTKFLRWSGSANPALPIHLRPLSWAALSTQSPRGLAGGKQTLRNCQIQAGMVFAGEARGCHATPLWNQRVKPPIHCTGPWPHAAAPLAASKALRTRHSFQASCHSRSRLTPSADSASLVFLGATRCWSADEMRGGRGSMWWAVNPPA